MKSNDAIINDYRKWLLYSFDNNEFGNYYDLFKALKTEQTVGTVIIDKDESLKLYLITHETTADKLRLTPEQKDSMAAYLIDNYFHTAEVDDIMLDKKQQAEKANNHDLGLNDRAHQFQSEFVIKPHPKETTYFNVRLAFSLIFYLVLALWIGYSIISDLSSVLSIVLAIVILGILILFKRLSTGIAMGIIRGSSVRVTKEQFPEVYSIVDEQRNKMQLDQMPEMYITRGHFNAFATRFSRSNILVIFSEVIETTSKGNYDILKYVTAHELCHIKRKHVTKDKYLFPSIVIPFLNLAYSRACEYTCDRVGYHFSPQGSVEGILVLTTGKEIYSKSNIELHMKDAISDEDFWIWLSEKFLSHPHLYKRLIAIKDYSKYN